MLNKKKPHGTILGTMSSMPDARYEQDGKFFNAQGLELDSKGKAMKTAKPKAGIPLQETLTPVSAADETEPDADETEPDETGALDETTPMPALKASFGPVVTDGKTKAELRAICKDRGISVARKDTLLTLTQKIHDAQAEAAE